MSNEEKAYYKLPSEFLHLEVQALLAAAKNTGSLLLQMLKVDENF